MSRTHIFNFFPGSIHNSRILKTLSLFASRQKITYLPNKNVWLNKLYFQISNSQEKNCLTIDTRDVNEFGPGKFTMSVNNREEQTCYFNRNKSDTHFTSFFARRTQAEPIQFSIVKQIFDFDFVNKSLDISATSSVSDGELKRQLQQDSSESFNNGRSKNKRRTNSDRLYDNTTESTDARQQQCGGLLRRDQAATRKNQDFSQQQNSESKIVNRHRIKYTATRIKYSPTRIKSRNFLSNISYTGISKNDFYNENFILDVYVLLVKNLNPFSLSRKVSDKTKHEMVYMLWRECIPPEFYRHICEEKNFIYLNG